MSDVIKLLKKYPPSNDQISPNELEIILNELSIIIANHVDGSIVEMGCYKAATSIYIARLLALSGHPRPLHIYDSFAGLPEKTAADNSPAGLQFQAGELFATKKEVLLLFKKANLPSPTIHKSWFEDLSPADIPESIAFAFLDGDYYSSIQSSLNLVAPQMTPGGVIIVDDYQNESLPGVKKAVDEWLSKRRNNLSVHSSLAIIHL